MIAILYQEPAMTPHTEPGQRLFSLFTEQPCWTIDPLAARLHYSVPSVRRFLSEVGYLSSFTHNGRWYTLREIPRFGRNSLWFYKDIGFSRAGSLTHTLVDLTVRSPGGMTADQLGGMLRCRCHSILVRLCRQGKLQREKVGRSYVYLAGDSSGADRQRRALQRPVPPQLPAEIALLVLVESIRHPEFGFKQLANTIARRAHVTIEAARIEKLFDRYDLKKTTPSGEKKL
jgi:hypothetical protein